MRWYYLLGGVCGAIWITTSLIAGTFLVVRLAGAPCKVRPSVQSIAGRAAILARAALEEGR